jgi:hypothetical protein
MQEYGFLPGLSIDPDAFWADCRRFAVAHRTDGVLAYMYMMRFAAARAGRPLTRGALESLGRSVEFYPGVEGWFDRVNAIGLAAGVRVEHYIISPASRRSSRLAHRRRVQGGVCGLLRVRRGGRGIWPPPTSTTRQDQYLSHQQGHPGRDQRLRSQRPHAEYLRRVPSPT